jgi:hypothetical protein
MRQRFLLGSRHPLRLCFAPRTNITTTAISTAGVGTHPGS